MPEPGRIRVTVDRLVLHGVAPSERGIVTEAFHEALHRALLQQGVIRPGAVPQLRLTLPSTLPKTARGLGQGAGASVGAALRRAGGGRA